LSKRTLLFPLHGFINWNGGIDLTRVLSAAIRHPAVANRYDLTFAFPEPSALQRAQAAVLRTWRLRLARGDGRSGSQAFLREMARQITNDNTVVSCSSSSRGIADAAKMANAEIVFPTMFPLGKVPVPRVGYLYDFQHRHLPGLFAARTRRNRDIHFARLAQDADAVIVNSHATAEDAVRFLGLSVEKILTIPYSPHALPWWFSLDPREAQARHSIGERYFLISNHFWKHKDHATALRAFALLRENIRFADTQLVLTGDPVDHRDPRHYSFLRQQCGELRIDHAVRFLGLIPKIDQLALLRGSMALIQPTLFEGGPGGGSVYEAIGLGVPAIVSDIPVNREIDQGDVRYFRAGDPADLAEKIAQTLATPIQRPTSESLLARGDANLFRLGQAIADFLDRVLVNRRA
jgi:glycosyltransferase involved in cell wall biosynthesis